MKKSNDRSYFWPKTHENSQSLALTEYVKAGKHMEGRDQDKARSTARNSFTKQTCSMVGAFPNHEMVKGRKHSTPEMRSEVDIRSQSISQTKLAWVKL